MTCSLNQKLMEIYHAMLEHFGPQHWWPGESEEEIIIGAVLTQNTNWDNVVRAIENLKRAGALSLNLIAQMPERRLAELIRPSGYFQIKAKRLKAVAQFFSESQIIEKWKKSGKLRENIREELLAVYGVGPETADSILLYAFGEPYFVIDAYTKRFCERHGLLKGKKADYETLRKFFEEHLPRDVGLYNEFHALFVRLGKTHCRLRPLCDECPLNSEKFYWKKS